MPCNRLFITTSSVFENLPTVRHQIETTNPRPAATIVQVRQAEEMSELMPNHTDTSNRGAAGTPNAWADIVSVHTDAFADEPSPGAAGDRPLVTPHPVGVRSIVGIRPPKLGGVTRMEEGDGVDRTVVAWCF
jgi:hypothetical protein